MRPASLAILGLASLAGAGAGACAHSNAAGAEPFGTLTVEQVDALVASGQASVFDNNNRDRYVQSHVPTAKWVAFDEVKAEALPPDRSRKLVFYCANPQ